MQPVGELVLVIAALGLDGEGDGRLGQRDPGKADGVGLVAHGVAGEGVTQFGHGADVAGVQLRYRDKVLALRNREMCQLFRCAASEVLQRGVVLHHAGEDFEERDASGKRIVGGLEDVNGSWRGITDLEIGSVAVPGADWFSVYCSMLCCRGEIIHHKVEQVVGPDIAQPGRKEHGENPVFFDSFVQCGNQVLFGDGPLVEKLFHQLVFAFSHNFHQLFMRFFGCGLKLGRDRPFFAFSATSHFVCVSLHGDQVDHALEALLAADRNLHRNHQPAEGADQAFQCGFIVGALAVHAAHHDDARQVDLVSVLPDLFRYYFHTGDSVHHHQRRFRRRHGDLGFMREHGETGRVKQIDLRVVPLQRGNRSGDGHLAGDFFFSLPS